VSFSVVAGGTPSLSYQWYRDNVALANGPKVTGATTPTLTINGDLSGGSALWDSGVYTVRITNLCNHVVTSASACIQSFNPILTMNLGLPSVGFASLPGLVYNVYYRSDLGPTASWQLLEGVIGTGTTNIVVDPDPNPVMRFYQVVPQPRP
jgi:hypothetical protein